MCIQGICLKDGVLLVALLVRNIANKGTYQSRLYNVNDITDEVCCRVLCVIIALFTRILPAKQILVLDLAH